MHFPLFAISASSLSSLCLAVRPRSCCAVSDRCSAMISGDQFASAGFQSLMGDAAQ